MSTTSAVPSIFDMNNLTALKSAAKKDDPKAIKAAAQQFEAMFMQMVLKSMRDATPREGMFDSEQTRMYEQLLDQQLSQVMSAKGSLGLAALIEKQLGKKDIDPEAFEEGLPLRPHGGKGFPIGDDVQGPLTLPPGTAAPRSYPLPGAATPTSGDGTQAARDFVTRVMPYAEEAARATGVPPSFLIGQAALETGWGRSEPRYARPITSSVSRRDEDGREPQSSQPPPNISTACRRSRPSASGPTHPMQRRSGITPRCY
jgi:flagellar protein FlgJ